MAIVCEIDATGIHKPDFSVILEYLKTEYRGIYGEDVYLENDSQDGQLLGIFAAAINDANAMAVAVYNAFSPSSAQGVGLSRVVKINGISRNLPSYSSADLEIVGQAGSTILGGLARDVNGYLWALPSVVNIPPGGAITVTATAQQVGAVAAAAGEINAIATPTLGWQSVTNPLAAVMGAPVEQDAQLRRRQTVSTALPSLTVLDGMIGAVASLQGVTRYAAYENDTSLTDADGVPSHSIAMVVEGGDAQAIADAILAKKTPGAGTYGTTEQSSVDVYGIRHAIRFFRPTLVPVTYALTVRALPGFTTGVQDAIRQALADWTNALAIGASVYLTRAYVPANLPSSPAGATFEIMSMTMARDGSTPVAADVAIAFSEVASGDIANVILTVV